MPKIGPSVWGGGGSSFPATLDTDATLAANSDTRVASQKATKTYADLMLPKAGGTMTGQLLLSAGSVSAPSAARPGDTNTGPYHPADDQYAIGTGGSQAILVNNSAVQVQRVLIANGGYWQQSQAVGSTFNLSRTTTKGLLYFDNPTPTINLPQVGYGLTQSVYEFIDELGTLSAATFVPWSDGFGTFNEINGGDSTYGAWDDGLGGMGPAGANSVVSQQGCRIRLTMTYQDTGVGAVGGWVLQIIAPNLSY